MATEQGLCSGKALFLKHNTNHFALKTKIMVEANKAAMSSLLKLTNDVIAA